MDNSMVNGSDDDEIEVTATEVYEKITEAWLNEKLAPDLLESRNEFVECMLAQVKELEEGFGKKDKRMECALQKVELERVKFVIVSYLRERLKKIEQNVVHVLENEANSTPKLSKEELDYAKSFAENMQGHMNSLALQHMPVNMQTIDTKKTTPRPNQDGYVFMNVNSGQNQVLLDPEEEPFDLEDESQHIVRYKPIAPLVESGAVSLL